MDKYRLPCDVKHGSGTFRKGVPVSTLQASINARVEYTSKLEKRIQELEEAVQVIKLHAEQGRGDHLIGSYVCEDICNLIYKTVDNKEDDDVIEDWKCALCGDSRSVCRCSGHY